MRIRRWIGLVALLGVLLHAGALVRHNAIVLGAALASQLQGVDGTLASLEADLAVICHPGSPEAAQRNSDLPSKASPDCPICSGLTAAFALAPAGLSELRARSHAAPCALPGDAAIVRASFELPPPARGPPLSA